MELQFVHHAAKESSDGIFTQLFPILWTALCAGFLCLVWPALGLRHRESWRTWSFRRCGWWATFAFAALLPVFLAHKVALPTSIRNIDQAITDALAFGERHPILVPRAAAAQRLYNGTDASLARWHRGMAALLGWIEARTPVGEVAEVIEFKMTEEAEHRVAPRVGVREARAAAVAAYFGIAASLWATDSVHLAVMLLELNVLETALALKIKTLDDATSAAVEQIKAAQLSFAMLPLEADAIGLAQQQLCLQKFEILHQAWSESMRLGQSVRVPFLANHLTLHVSLILSVVAATSLRALEVLLGALFPDMPRYAIVRKLARFLAGRLRGIHAVVLESPEAAAALQAPRTLLRSLSTTKHAGVQQVVSGANMLGGDSVTSAVLNATRDGGFLVTGSLAISSADRKVTIKEAEEVHGFELTLNGSSVTTSPVASGAACVYMAFAAATPVDAFLSTYDDFVNLVTTRGTFDLTAAMRVPGSDFAGKVSGNATVAVSPAQYYVLVMANTGASAPTDVLYQFATYSAASPACALAGSRTSTDWSGRNNAVQAPAAAPALALAASSAPATTPFLFDFTRLSSGDIQLVTVITNAVCICYQLLGQLRAGPSSQLDLVAFITTQRGTLVWARNGFGSRVPAAIVGSLCSQTTSQRGLCEAAVAGLNASERYYLWVASGLQHPRQPPDDADVPLRFTARAEGRCASVAFPRQPRGSQPSTPSPSDPVLSGGGQPPAEKASDPTLSGGALSAGGPTAEPSALGDSGYVGGSLSAGGAGARPVMDGTALGTGGPQVPASAVADPTAAIASAASDTTSSRGSGGFTSESAPTQALLLPLPATEAGADSSVAAAAPGPAAR
ncbi:hypothetical protein WJX81_006998 [Elliptochloris bilobata]|uniref:Uncharacterized protein n=1 Tax=Elliptochloris bilobata TaxID=381761 RepID=A0AAW1RQ21_9CHLO